MTLTMRWLRGDAVVRSLPWTSADPEELKGHAREVLSRHHSWSNDSFEQSTRAPQSVSFLDDDGREILRDDLVDLHIDKLKARF